MAKFKRGRKHKKMRGRIWLEGLRDLIAWANLPQGYMVEVGVYAGQSTEEFAKVFRKVVAIDPFKPYAAKDAEELKSAYRAFQKRMARYRNIVHVRGFSLASSGIFEPESLDMVYLDGNHSYLNIRNDILHWLPKIRRGGVLAGHDYGIKVHAVKKAVQAFLGEPDRIFKDSSFAFRLPENLPPLDAFPRVAEARDLLKLRSFR